MKRFRTVNSQTCFSLNGITKGLFVLHEMKCGVKNHIRQKMHHRLDQRKQYKMQMGSKSRGWSLICFHSNFWISRGPQNFYFEFVKDLQNGVYSLQNCQSSFLTPLKSPHWPPFVPLWRKWNSSFAKEAKQNMEMTKRERKKRIFAFSSRMKCSTVGIHILFR